MGSLENKRSSRVSVVSRIILFQVILTGDLVTWDLPKTPRLSSFDKYKFKTKDMKVFEILRYFLEPLLGGEIGRHMWVVILGQASHSMTSDSRGKELCTSFRLMIRSASTSSYFFPVDVFSHKETHLGFAGISSTDLTMWLSVDTDKGLVEVLWVGLWNMVFVDVYSVCHFFMILRAS